MNLFMYEEWKGLIDIEPHSSDDKYKLNTVPADYIEELKSWLLDFCADISSKKSIEDYSKHFERYKVLTSKIQGDKKKLSYTGDLKTAIYILTYRLYMANGITQEKICDLLGFGKNQFTKWGIKPAVDYEIKSSQYMDFYGLFSKENSKQVFSILCKYLLRCSYKYCYIFSNDSSLIASMPNVVKKVKEGKSKNFIFVSNEELVDDEMEYLFHKYFTDSDCNVSKVKNRIKSIRANLVREGCKLFPVYLLDKYFCEEGIRVDDYCLTSLSHREYVNDLLDEFGEYIDADEDRATYEKLLKYIHLDRLVTNVSLSDLKDFFEEQYETLSGVDYCAMYLLYRLSKTQVDEMLKTTELNDYTDRFISSTIKGINDSSIDNLFVSSNNSSDGSIVYIDFDCMDVQISRGLLHIISKFKGDFSVICKSSSKINDLVYKEEIRESNMYFYIV